MMCIRDRRPFKSNERDLVKKYFLGLDLLKKSLC